MFVFVGGSVRPGPGLLKSLHEIGILIMLRDLFMRQLN